MGNPPRGTKRALYLTAAVVVLVAIASAVVLSTRKSPYDKCEAEVRAGLTPGEVVAHPDPCRGLAGSTGPPVAEMLVVTLVLACVIAGAGLVVKSGAKDETEGTRKSFPLNFAALWTTRMRR